MSDRVPGGGGGKSQTVQVVLSEVVAGGVTLFVLWVATRWLQKLVNPLMEDNENQKMMQKAVLERLLKSGADPRKLEGLSQWEMTVAGELVYPEDIEGGLEQIGGLEEVKQILHDDILIPLERPDVFDANPLLNPPRGILLYGPPGTGKTSLAKALAKQSGIHFICLTPSSLLSKWVGDTQHLTRAIFSLASRLEPCIIFLDEIDALFRERSSGDHEVYRDLKAEFMQLWDGLFTTSLCRIIVIGCTNRPWDVDPAIQRRLPRAVRVDLPNASERTKILRAILKRTITAADLDLDVVAERTTGFSGSDLRELCRCALLIPMKEKVNKERSKKGNPYLRPLTTHDLLGALDTVNPTARECENYREEQFRRSEGGMFTTNLGESDLNTMPLNQTDVLREVVAAIAGSVPPQSARPNRSQDLNLD